MSDMTQTENYIILKPLAERFSRIAQGITDDEIKFLIKNSLKEQLAKSGIADIVGEIIQDWVEDNRENIIKEFSSSLLNGMSNMFSGNR